MATYAFDIYPSDDPRGKISGTGFSARLARLSIDGSLVGGWFKAVGFGVGEGEIKIHTDHADAVEANFAKRNYVVFVRTDTDPDQQIGGFFLEEGDFKALSRQERGGRILTFGGPGGLWLLDRYRLGHSHYAPAQPHRGDFDIADMWTWSQEPYGAMLVRCIEEGKYHPDEFFAAITVDFNRTRDSNDLQWDELSDYQTPIGTSVLDLYADFSSLGLISQMSADLTLRAYRDIDEFSTDRTSATFTAGKTRFAAGVNIENELPRRIAASQERTHVLIRDRIGDYETVDEDLNLDPLTSEPYMAFLKSDTTADDDAIRKMGRIHLTRRKQYADQAIVQHIIGDDTGQYAPGPLADYWVLDRVTLHTGSDAHDFDEADIEVSSIKFYHDDAGNWFAETELGAQYINASIERFQSGLTSLIRDIQKVQFCEPRVVTDVGITFVDCFALNMSNGDDLTAAHLHSLNPQVGDLLLAHISSDSDNTIPTAATGWTAIGSGGFGTLVSSRGFYRFYTGTETGDYDFGNGDSILIHVYRGALASDPIGSINGTGAHSTTMTWPALSGGSAMEVTDGSSWVAAFGHTTQRVIAHTALSANDVEDRCGNNPTAEAGERDKDEHGSWDTDGGVTSWSAHTKTITSDEWQTSVYEIKAETASTVVNAGAGRVELVGTSVKAKRCDDTEHWHEVGTGSPTVNDDADLGFRNGTLWINDNGDVWFLADNTSGAADWIQFGGGGGYVTVNYVIDGGGSVLTTGDKGDISLDFSGVIEQVQTRSRTSGSVVVDIKKTNTAGYDGSFASICASAKPTLSSQKIATNTTLTGWTTTIAAGDILSYNVDSATTVTRVTVSLKIRKT